MSDEDDIFADGYAVGHSEGVFEGLEDGYANALFDIAGSFGILNDDEDTIHSLSVSTLKARMGGKLERVTAHAATAAVAQAKGRNQLAANRVSAEESWQDMAGVGRLLGINPHEVEGDLDTTRLEALIQRVEDRIEELIRLESLIGNAEVIQVHTVPKGEDCGHCDRTCLPQ